MMTLLTGWQSILARIGMVVLIVVAIFLGGWFKGHASEAHVFAAYRQQLALQSAVQVQHNADLVKQQRETSARIEGNYEHQIAALRARSSADWLRYEPGPGIVPGLSGAPQGDDAGPADALPLECAETTAQLINLQEWVRAQQDRQ